MAIFLILIGALFVVVGINNTQGDLVTLLKGDVPGFIHTLVAILAIGAIGYIPRLKPISDGFLMLILLAIVLTNGKRGLFQQFQNQLGSGAQVNG